MAQLPASQWRLRKGHSDDAEDYGKYIEERQERFGLGRKIRPNFLNAKTMSRLRAPPNMRQVLESVRPWGVFA